LAVSITFGQAASAEEAPSVHCIPALEVSAGAGDGLRTLPSGRALSGFAFSSVDFSFCNLSVGASAAQAMLESKDFEQSGYIVFSYTLGVVDISAGIRSVDSHALASFDHTSGFIDLRGHPSDYSEIKVNLASGLSDRDWTLEVGGISRLAVYPIAAVYGYLSYEYARERDREALHGAAPLSGGLASFGLRLKHYAFRNVLVFGDVGLSKMNSYAGNPSNTTPRLLIGVTYRLGYFEASEVGHLGIAGR
jgi:hypothetical protein